MSIIQISKIQQRSGDLVDLPQLDEAELGFASDTKQLFIGKEAPNENIEVLTSYSEIAFSQIVGSDGNLDIDSTTLANGQVLTYDGNNWINRGGDAGGLIDLGSNANVKLSGGAIGYVLTTDGTGNLIWAPKTTIIGYIKDVSAADPAVLTTTSNVEFVNDSYVTISGILGNSTSNVGSVLNGNSFYLQVLTPNTFALYTSSGATGNVDTTGLSFPYTTVSATNSGTDRLTAASTTGFAQDDPVIFLGNTNYANTGIVADTTYYVKTIVNSTTFTISETVGGATFELGTNAVGWAGCEVYTPGGQAVALITSGAGNIGAAATDTTIQYNKNNILAGSASFTYDYNTSVLGLSGNANISGNVNVTTRVLASTLQSNVATGTAPLIVASTTKVTNLNADLLDGYDSSLTATANTVVVRDANANIVGNNISGIISTAAQPNITSVGTLTSLVVAGNITAGNVAGGNLVSGNFIAGTLTTAAQPSITSLGTLTALTVSGNIAAGNVFANSGTVGAANLTGTLTTAAQPNITSVGTLTSLTVSGTATVGNLTTGGVITGNGSGISVINASNIATGTLAQARLANSSLTINGTTVALGGSGTITANATQALTIGTYLTGSPTTTYNGGTAVTVAVDATSSNTASKVVVRDGSGGFSAGTITATLNGSATSATTAGTVTTAAQPNITSVGTLTSLTVSGALTTTQITTGANTTAGNITGNWTLTSGSRLQATYADLAEYYAADKHYPAGTVLDFAGEQEVTIAGIESNKIAGVVSADPAYVMNGMINCEHPVAIALQGRVPCKVQGNVRKGDMMVSAGDGFAKAATSEPKMGTVIGKALANFDGDEGVIEVVVGRL
jgi:hypothetical protein